MSGQAGFEVQDKDYRFAYLSLEAGDQVKHGSSAPPHYHHHHTCTPIHPCLSGAKCFPKPCIAVSKVLELEVAAAVAAEGERLKDQS